MSVYDPFNNVKPLGVAVAWILLLGLMETMMRLEAEWKPIETAPRNGTKVLVVESNGLRSIAYWSGGNWWQDDVYGRAGKRANFDVYSGWMPLPPPVTYNRQVQP